MVRPMPAPSASPIDLLSGAEQVSHVKKRTFLKLSSALITGAVLSPILGCRKGERLKNWAGNLEYSTDRVYYPSSVEQVQEFVKKADKMRALGTRHCFSRIADSA